MNLTQKDKVIYQLKTRKFVSRNWCIFHQPRNDGGITRLSGIIKVLKKEGWILNGRKAKTQWGEDFIYEVGNQKTLL